jgi:MvaI/BcnI restriction endonuclease family
MAFQNVDQLLARFKALGAVRVFCKHLAENDNSKQQIYLGSSFEVLSFFPYGEITAYPDLKEPNFKAPLELYWVDTGTIEKAIGTQLILYPGYPEVRLSGFLAGCKTAPSKHLQQRPKEERRGYDGRVLVFGTTTDGKTFAHLAPDATPLANELLNRFAVVAFDGLFLELTLPVGSLQNRILVLDALREIHQRGFHASCKRNKHGQTAPYKALNGGGYTLEALLGINPNGAAEPDYLGWEIKAHSQPRVTLMTPEPNGGFYGEQGMRAFVELYGHDTAKGDTYFTGTHKVGIPCAATKMTMQIRGYDPSAPQLLDVNGAIYLTDAVGDEAASWAFANLLTHWNRKHAFAAYIPFTSQNDPRAYRYDSPVLMGEHTDFTKYLRALHFGLIVFDPGSKISGPLASKPDNKARSQFRIHTKHLDQLYERLIPEQLDK